MAESLIYDLCKAVASKLKEEGSRLSGVPEEAKKMELNLEAIKAVLKAAEQRELDDGVKQWIRDLKDVAYDIEDVLDDWSIAQLQMQDQAGTSQRGNMSIPQGFFSCIPSSPCFSFKQARSRHGIADAILKINERLDDIDKRKQKFDFPTTITSKSEGPKRESSTSYGNCAVVDSQTNSKAELIEKLVDSGFKCSVADHIPIICIVGMGGVGKTTVAQLVYNDDTVKKNFPQKIAWVCVSNNFDEVNVAKAIACNLCRISANDSDLQSVLTQIENNIRGTKFLLVLDDVWETSEEKWAPILNCLSKGDTQGSRILITTRDSDFFRKMGANIVSVDELSETDALLLFNFYAFRGDPDHRGIVEDIVVQLVKKCGGLPLALRVLGIYMAAKTTRREWNRVLSSKTWETQFEEKVFHSLAFSYLELRSQAKRCFAFCSVFPKDTIMRKSNLIRLWTAQGYLQGADQTEVLREEALGEECFESLLRRSFFQVYKSYDDEATDIGVTMHDLVHDFAQYVSNEEVAILDPSNETKGSAHLRHLAFSREISESECPPPSLKLRALRTLFLRTQKSAVVLDELCSNKSYIRVLEMRIFFALDGYVSKDIGKLIHLRYLCLCSDQRTELPEEICRLPYLQTLDVRGCVFLEKLPKDIGRLTMLRHLLFDKQRMISLPKGLGKLSSLRTLSGFMCCGLANEDCSSLEGLRDLNNLRGDLTLRNLGSVANVHEATRAALHEKTQISLLKLHFGDGDASIQSEVLKSLQPAKENIEYLEIKDYRGNVCPPWTGQMRCLRTVKLENVGMSSLPELGTLSFLEELIVRTATEVRCVGAEIFGKVEQGQAFFPKLKSLEFSYMSNWEHWGGPEEKMGCGVTVMPSLRRLNISSCKSLQTLPRFLEHVPLKSFRVGSFLWLPVDLADDDCLGRLRIGDILLPRTLRYIELCNLEDDRLPPLGSLAYLEELIIGNAKKVEKVGDEFLGDHSERGESTEPFVAFPRLQVLTFRCMPAWREWEDPVHGNNLIIMPSLCEFNIKGCKMLKSLPHFFEALASLNILSVAATAEGDLPKIRNTTNIGEDKAAYEMGKARSTAATPAQLELREIQLDGVRKEWLLDWAKYCVRLRVLRLVNCAEASYVGQLEVSLPSLAILEVSARDFRGMGMEILSISSLESLRFFNMHEWEEWDDAPPHQPEIINNESRELSQHGNNNNNSSIINVTSNLRLLYFTRCPKLKALPSFLRSVCTLDELQIKECPALRTWWEIETDEDWRRWMSAIPKVTLPHF